MRSEQYNDVSDKNNKIKPEKVKDILINLSVTYSTHIFS